jgi:hypothetical protein
MPDYHYVNRSRPGPNESRDGEEEPPSRLFKLLPQAEEAQYGNDNNHKTDDIDNIVHKDPPFGGEMPSQTKMKTSRQVLPLLQQPVSFPSGVYTDQSRVSILRASTPVNAARVRTSICEDSYQT